MGGDFTGQWQIYDPTTQTIAHDSLGNPYPVRQSFASENTGALAGKNAIPSSLFDSVALKYEQLYPDACEPYLHFIDKHPAKLHH